MKSAMYRATLDWRAPEGPKPAGVIQLAAGDSHSLALKDDGTVWAWGCNSSGQLGDGTTEHRNTPVQVGVQPAGEDNKLTNVRAIAAGGSHSLALKDDGTIWAWGCNSYGQLGNGATTDRAVPVQVGSQVCKLSGLEALAAGGLHSLALKDDGTVWVWGRNISGQLGLGDGATTIKTFPVQIDDFKEVRALAAGDSHSLALKDDGTVWAWGCNSSGQLGDGTTEHRNTPVQVGVQPAGEDNKLTNVRAIAAGSSHSLALKGDGTVWAWGSNNKGQLGDGTTTGRGVPIQIGAQTDGEGKKLTGIRAIAVGHYHSLALKDDGTIWAWGYNSYGQLGNGATTDRTVPVQVGSQACKLSGLEALAAGGLHSLALKDDGAVWAWGGNSYGQLGDGTKDNRRIPVQVIFE
ncbi:MAG: hypothetical protein GX989_01465 [Firmicutes bacterium]|nr:hypothetical protein [Bacillota bacterium]